MVVPDDQLSLAIGRRGQNVRLASQLTGSAIDIMTEADASEKRQREFVERSELFQKELDVDETLAQLLVAEGFGALEEVAYVELEELCVDRGLRRGARRPSCRAAPPRRCSARRRRPARSAARWASTTSSPKCPISPRRCWSPWARPGSGRSTTSPTSPPTSWSRRSGPSSAASARATGPRTKAGVLADYGLTDEQGNEIIMAARAHWFEDEDAKAGEDADAETSQ